MKIHSLIFILIAGCSLPFSSCIDSHPDGLEIHPIPRTAPVSTMTKVQLSKLDEIAPPKSDSGKLVADLRLILQAEQLSSDKKHKEAAETYFEALKIAKDDFGKEAMKGWIVNYAQSLEQKTKSTFIARVLLDIAQKGTQSPYMLANKITTVESLNKIVSDVAKDVILPEDGDSPLSPFPDAPKRKGIPADDPTLAETSKTYCEGKGKPSYQWDAWKKKLKKPVRRYWLGMVEKCKNNHRKSAKYFERALPGLSKSRKTANLAVRAAYRIVRHKRNNANRKGAAESYVTLMKTWSLKGLSAKGMGMTKQEFHLERVNDALWAARYRSLIGDYQSSRIYANQALKSVSRAFTKTKLLNEDFREKLSDYQAEAYMVLANRIAVEEKNLELAASQMIVATEKIQHASKKMQEKLLWYAGLYQYLSGHLRLATNKWEDLLAITEEDSTKARTYFWIARAYKKIGEKSKSEDYITRLHHDYPINYYTVVASEETSLDSEHKWRGIFPSFDEQAKRLNDQSYKNLVLELGDKNIENLVDRAEIIIQANLGKWALYSVKALNTPFKKAFDIKKTPEAYLYLSRIHFEAESYLQSIIYTTSLARSHEEFWFKWPEQLLIYFPRPYSDIYARNALETSLDENLLFSVSRQESAFKKKTKSHANAYGLMQLILPSAERFAEEAGFEKEGLKSKLYEPAVSIALGSRYLKNLSLNYKGSIPAILGAYNAGEYAVDNWIERRQQSDLLAWIELVPFGETRGYIKNVWRNHVVYNQIRSQIHASRVQQQSAVTRTASREIQSKNERVH